MEIARPSPREAQRAKRGAARGTRTPDPVITNDVLYQLSYCGGAPGKPSKTRAHLISGGGPIGKKNGYLKELLPAPASPETAPAADLSLGCANLFREFIARRRVVDAGIIGGPDDGNDGGNRHLRGFGEIGAGAEQGCGRI